MCGIAGFYWHEEQSLSAGVLDRMANAIAHRGPDDAGIWLDSASGIGLAHRRLSILDLSPTGHQPMVSASGRYVVVFNGEVYNHLSLRVAIENNYSNVNWRGHSDTEVLLAAFEYWGIEATLGRTIGMFALAVWDKKDRCLTLARDRLGEKPLYYGWQGAGPNAAFIFGSELKALKQHPYCTREVNRTAISLLLRYNYIPTPYTVYERLFKLPAGHLVVIKEEHFERHITPVSTPYWSLSSVAVAGVAQTWHGSDTEAINQLDTLLRDTICQQLVADVPVGAFLSGGIDSSIIVALMQVQSSRPIKTFSIGFNERSYDEARYARAVANYLGTDHTDLYVCPNQALSALQVLPTLYDEPFADSSQIPTYLVSKLAGQHVTVSLSGDGGDELFCGYNRYLISNDWWGKLDAMPIAVRKVAAKLLTWVSPDRWNQLAPYLPYSNQHTNFGDRLHKAAEVVDAPSLDALYFKFISHWANPSSVVIGGFDASTIFSERLPALPGLSDVQQMMVLDTLTYLPDDILVKLDRASMGASLESRAPFLDHRIVEFAWTLPQSLKVRNGKSKWILRELLYRHVPKELIERPKRGFGIPLGLWLRGPLKEWAEALLSEARLRDEGFFNPAPIRLKWTEHLSGKRNWQYHLWGVLMFQAWLEKQ